MKLLKLLEEAKLEELEELGLSGAQLVRAFSIRLRKIIKILCKSI